METVELQLAKRTDTGKSKARKARSDGRIPGILYGHKSEPVMFEVGAHGFEQLLVKSPFGRNQVMDVRGIERNVTALIKDLQIHPVSRQILHFDLLEVRPEDRLEVVVPVRYEGRAAGQSAGGTVQLLMRSVRLTCTPGQIPEAIVLDVRPLGVGESISVGDLPVPEGSKVFGNQKLIVLTVKAPRVSGKKDEEEES